MSPFRIQTVVIRGGSRRQHHGCPALSPSVAAETQLTNTTGGAYRPFMHSEPLHATTASSVRHHKANHVCRRLLPTWSRPSSSLTTCVSGIAPSWFRVVELRSSWHTVFFVRRWLLRSGHFAAKGSKRFRPPAGSSGMVAPSIPRVTGNSFWQFLQPQSRSSISVLLCVTDPLDLSSCVKHAGPADTAQGTQHLLLPAHRAHSPVQRRVYVRLSVQMVPHLHGRQATES